MVLDLDDLANGDSLALKREGVEGLIVYRIIVNRPEFKQ